MRSVIIKDSTDNKCGICKESEPWVKELNREGVCFLYCCKCNTITFYDDIEYNTQIRIENILNKEYYKKRENKKHD